MSFTFSVAAYVVIKSLLLWSVINYEERECGHWGHSGGELQYGDPGHGMDFPNSTMGAKQ